MGSLNMRKSELKKQEIIVKVEELKDLIESYNEDSKDSKFLIDLNLVYQERDKYGSMDKSKKSSSMLDIKFSNKKNARYYSLLDEDIAEGSNVVKFEDIKSKKRE